MTNPPGAALEVRARFAGAPRKLSAPRVLAFSGGAFDAPGWPARNLHTDPAKAKEAGRAAPIASGLQFEGHLVELLYEIFAENWLASGVLQVKYPRPVLSDDVVEAVAQVSALEPDGAEIRVSLDAWCSRAGGTKVLIGTASCMIPA
jgi:acyl dehydratase